MEAEITKKDLLQQTGISYGQLYRWKRMGLIPEEWFVRKATFTGTETFFPRERVLARIEKIKSMKDGDLSLEEIAEVVSPALGKVALTPEETMARRVAGRAAIDLFASERTTDGAFALGDVLTLYVLDALLRDGSITADEGRALVGAMPAGLAGEVESESDALLVRKAGLSLWAIVPRTCKPRFEEGARVVVRVDLAARLEDLKSLLTNERKTR